MTIHYLILAHDNFDFIDDLIAALNCEQAKFYVHIDKKTRANYKNELPNVTVLQKRVYVYWGGWSVIRATLALLRAAFKRGSAGDYYALLSGSCYPICSNEDIRKKFLEGGVFMNLELVAPGSHFFYRQDRYYFDHDRFLRRKHGAVNILERLKNFVHKKLEHRMKNRRRVVPFDIYWGSQWFALPHECTAYILEQASQGGLYCRHFKHSLVPDDSFFHTIVGNSSFAAAAKPCVTFTDWEGSETGDHPADLTVWHVGKFLSERVFHPHDMTHLFARKVGKKNAHVREYIERILRR